MFFYHLSGTWYVVPFFIFNELRFSVERKIAHSSSLNNIIPWVGSWSRASWNGLIDNIWQTFLNQLSKLGKCVFFSKQRQSMQFLSTLFSSFLLNHYSQNSSSTGTYVHIIHCTVRMSSHWTKIVFWIEHKDKIYILCRWYRRRGTWNVY